MKAILNTRVMTLLLCLFLLIGLGLLNLYSATSDYEKGYTTNLLFRSQVMWHAIGLGLAVVIMLVNYRHFFPLAPFIYFACVGLLIAVLVLGHSVSGHQSWIRLGGLRIQPTEFAKIGVLIMLAYHLCRQNPLEKAGFIDLLIPFLILGLPSGLVILQGDLGSALVYIFIGITLLLVRGIRLRVLTILLCGTIALSVLAYFSFLSPYQKKRIQTFANPEKDPKGAGYHLIQAKIAIGSGQIIGEGFLKGKSHRLKFIPERHTDFIFTVWAEEWGFLGSVVNLAVYLGCLLAILAIAIQSTDRFAYYLSIGFFSLFFWHWAINLGGVTGIMPLTGVPLPFQSYGGSSLVTSWASIGFILSLAFGHKKTERSLMS